VAESEASILVNRSSNLKYPILLYTPLRSSLTQIYVSPVEAKQGIEPVKIKMVSKNNITRNFICNLPFICILLLYRRPPGISLIEFDSLTQNSGEIIGAAPKVKTFGTAP
jgi:hypothetical protein